MNPSAYSPGFVITITKDNYTLDQFQVYISMLIRAGYNCTLHWSTDSIDVEITSYNVNAN